MKMEQTGGFETLVFKLQTPVNRPEESIENSEQGESLKSRVQISSLVSTKFPRSHCLK
jgi:hypothetical protein